MFFNVLGNFKVGLMWPHACRKGGAFVLKRGWALRHEASLQSISVLSAFVNRATKMGGKSSYGDVLQVECLLVE